VRQNPTSVAISFGSSSEIDDQTHIPLDSRSSENLGKISQSVSNFLERHSPQFTDNMRTLLNSNHITQNAEQGDDSPVQELTLKVYRFEDDYFQPDGHKEVEARLTFNSDSGQYSNPRFMTTGSEDDSWGIGVKQAIVNGLDQYNSNLEIQPGIPTWIEIPGNDA